MWEVWLNFLGYRTYGLHFDPLNPKNWDFQSVWGKKKLFYCVSWQPGVQFPFSFFIQLFLDLWVVWVTFLCYRTYRLHFEPPNPKNIDFQCIWGIKAVFLVISIKKSPIPIVFLPTTLFRCVGGVTLVSLQSDLQFVFWPPKPQKTQFFKALEGKKFIFLRILITGVQFLYCFILLLSIDLLMVRVLFLGYRIYGLLFDSPNPQNLVFQRIRGAKGVLSRIFVTWRRITITLLPTNFYTHVGCVSQVLWLSDLRFAFLNPKPQKLRFVKSTR